MQNYDVAIVGGGIAGLSLAYFLAGRRSVVVLEQETALGYHSTGRSAAEFVLRYNSPEVRKSASLRPFPGSSSMRRPTVSPTSPCSARAAASPSPMLKRLRGFWPSSRKSGVTPRFRC